MALGSREKNFEALTSATGEAINEVAGFRFTRVRTQTVSGSTSIDVETVSGWPSSGTVIIGGIAYSYTGIGGTPTLPTITGLSYLDGGTTVSGTAAQYETGDEVLDFSRVFSALDQLRAQFLVDTADGESLSVLGRNLGVDRVPGLEDDDQFRSAIKALAYARKGTVQALEIALDAFFGAGNYVLYEDLENVPNTVFIQLLGGLAFSSSAQGRAFLSVSEARPYDSGTRQASVLGTISTVEGVRLEDELFDERMSSGIPSTFTEVRYEGDAGVPVWTYQGTNEATVTVDTSDGGRTILDGFSAGDTHLYDRLSRIRPESDAYLRVLFEIDPGTTLSASTADARQWTMKISDGQTLAEVGILAGGSLDFQAGFIDAGGNFLGSTIDLSLGQYYDMAIRKSGTDVVDLLVDGVLVDRLPYASLVAGAENKFAWGFTSPVNQIIYVQTLSFWARTATDYWNDSGSLGQTRTANPQEFDTNAANIDAGDVGKAIRIYGSGEVNGQGGNNNFQGLVATATPPDLVTVVGETRKRAFTESANPNRIQVAAPASSNRAFVYPDDLGKSIELINGASPGPHVITSLLDPVTKTPLTGSQRVTTDICEVGGTPSFGTETDLDWRLTPNFVDENPPGSGLGWELSETGVFTAPSTVETRAVIPLVGFGAQDIIVRVAYTVVLSAQVLGDANDANSPVGAYYPFYLAPNPLGAFASYIDELTVAGVLPEVVFGV